MKRLVIIVTLFVCAVQSKAQFSFGPKAGVNIAKIVFSNKDYATSYMPRIYGGVFANYAFASVFAVQAELQYSGEGGKEKNVNSGTKGNIKESFLQLPVLFQYVHPAGFYAETGPQIGLLLSSKETFNGNTQSIKKYYKSTDLRWPLGIGYLFKNESLKGFGINARYSFSLSKINKAAIGGATLKNDVISVGVQYALPSSLFKKK